MEQIDLKEKAERAMYALMENYVTFLGDKNVEMLLTLFENDGQTAMIYSTSPKCDEFPLLCPGPYPASDFYPRIFEIDLNSMELETYPLDSNGYSLALYTPTRNTINEEGQINDDYRDIGYGYTTFVLRDTAGSFEGVYVDLFEFSELTDRNGESIIKIRKLTMFENLQMPISK